MEIIRNTEPRFYRGNYIATKNGNYAASFMLYSEAEEFIKTGDAKAAIFKFIS